jgi:hypothetical protein
VRARAHLLRNVSLRGNKSRDVRLSMQLRREIEAGVRQFQGDTLMKRIEVLNVAKHVHVAAVLVAAVVTLAAFSSAQSTPMHESKKGNLSIAEPTEVGGVTLQPGDYAVREVKSQQGPVVEFVRKFRNELASELVQADEEEVVARVKFTGQILSVPPKHTQLQLASNTNDAIALEIRGNPVSYVFNPAPMAAQR